MSTPHAAPNPSLIVQTLNAYQQTYALKAAIHLEIFTHIAGGATTAAEIANRVGAAERGIRILCDYLTVIGFLTKADGIYALAPTSARFLDKNSPTYIGSTSHFMAHET